jgi:lysophospholipase L1-like esterase
MKSLALFFGLLVFGFFKPSEKKKIRIFMAGDSTMSIKETRFYPETGWGMPFVHFWDSAVTVVNKSKNGRSTKSFRAEGLWQEIMTDLSEDDFVIIQFGHNDEVKEKVERYTTAEEFSANLERFIQEVRSKKATPILLTPVARRKFDSTGQLVDTHLQYSDTG